jgi:hypothetical protein
MIYRVLADLVVLAHFLFLAFVVLGGLLVLRRPRWAWIHIPAALWGTVIEWAGWMCPLTPLENHLRVLGGEAPYGGGFIARYLLPIVYPGALTRELQIVLGLGVLVLNLGLYAAGLHRHRARARHTTATTRQTPP